MTRYEVLVAKIAETKARERDDEKRKASAGAKAFEAMQRLVHAQVKGFLAANGFPECHVWYVTEDDRKVKFDELPALFRRQGQTAQWRVVFEANVSGILEKYSLLARAEWLLKPVGGGKIEFHYGACRVILPGAPPDELFRNTWETFERTALKKDSLVPL